MTGEKAVRVFAISILSIVLLCAGWSLGLASGQSQEATKPDAVQGSSASSPPASFQAALGAAEANLASKKGKEYDGKFGISAGAWLEPEISRCMKEVEWTVHGPFTVLIRVGKVGKAEEVLTWPETHIADCLKPKFAAAVYPKPPKPSWWCKIDIRIKPRDRENGTREASAAVRATTGIPYGGDLGVMVEAPAGWVLDNRSGVSQGTPCVMYPEGSSWQNAPEVMYVNVNKLAPGETFERHVAADADSFRREFPAVRIEEFEPISLRDGGKALVRGFSGGGYPSLECVAYAPYADGAATFVLTCRTPDGLDKTTPLFRKVVARSYPVRMNFDGGALSVSLLEPPTAAEAAARALPFWDMGGYSYWSRFKPGTFVTFRYSVKSAGTTQEWLKTVTLKEVTPDSVRLEYSESPVGQPGRPLAWMRDPDIRASRFSFHAADDDFQKRDLFGGQLSLSPGVILEVSRGKEIETGAESFDWKGAKLSVERKKYLSGQPGAWTAMAFWLSAEVPGAAVRMTRELQGAAAFKEEYVLEDFRAVRAGPEEIERLRSLHKPTAVEIDGQAYLEGRFRYIQGFEATVSELRTTFIRRMGQDFDLVDVMKLFSWLPAQLREAQRQFREEEKAVASELGAEQTEKLRPLLDETGQIIALIVKEAESMQDYLGRLIANPADRSLHKSMEDEMDTFLSEMIAGAKRLIEESRKAKDIKLKFFR